MSWLVSGRYKLKGSISGAFMNNLKSLTKAAMAAFFVSAVSGCSGLSSKDRMALIQSQIEQRQSAAEPVLKIDCGESPCQFQSLELRAEIVQQQIASTQIQLPDSLSQTLVKEFGATTRAVVSTAAQVAGQAAPYYFLSDVARAGIQSAGDRIRTDNTHSPTVVDPVIVTQPEPVIVQPQVVNPQVVNPVVVPSYVSGVQ